MVIAPTGSSGFAVHSRLPPFRKERDRMGHPSFVCDLGFADEWVGHLSADANPPRPS